MGTYNTLVDLMGHEQLGGKTMLFMIDGLYGAEDQSSEPNRFQSAPFNNDWTSSLFVSQDGVAIDSVALDFLRNEPTVTELEEAADNYLHEAAQAGNPPSGTFYDPEGDGTSLTSLGVHEHWNNATDKQYSRNLATGEGIELVSQQPQSNAPPTVCIVAPLDGMVLQLGAEIVFTVDCADRDGSVVKVEYIDAASSSTLGEATGPPFGLRLPATQEGTLEVIARATDDGGATADSAPITVTIRETTRVRIPWSLLP
jgi:hypothetical protein